MRIFIDIGHPAHFHYFKNLTKIIKKKGDHVFISVRDKDVAKQLIENEGFKYYNRGIGADKLFSKALYLFKTDYNLFKQAKKFNPDIFLSAGSPYAAHVSKLLSKPHIILSDTESARLNQLITWPFTNAILNPNAYKKRFKKQIRFNGFLELCYLHPNYFCPQKDILDTLGITENEKYVIIRLVNWTASHDQGHDGLSYTYKKRLVKELAKYAKVFISSEGELPNELKKYDINIPAHRMHDALAFANLLYGESATMASESALLGTPAIFHNDFELGYTMYLEEHYGMVSNYSESDEDQMRGLKRAIEILKMNDAKRVYKEKRDQLIADKIDVTRFLEWFIYNYPDSFDLMKQDPTIQNQFRGKKKRDIL
jgi:predicted glycosyltransferase